MNAHDPRHHTVAGYRAGCRDTCCRDAIAKYNQRRKLYPGARLIPAHGTALRLQALNALGWSFPTIAKHTGIERSYLRLLAKAHYPQLRPTTAARITRTYDALSMRLPAQDTPARRGSVARTRRQAQDRGWLPPLALDDARVDDPTYRPTKHLTATERAQLREHPDAAIDHAVIERVLAGEPRPRRLTHAEATEIHRRLTATGLSGRQIEDTWGINPTRYTNTSGDAA